MIQPRETKIHRGKKHSGIFLLGVFGVDNSAASVHTRLCKLLESNWMMEDGVGWGFGVAFPLEGRVAPLSLALSIIPSSFQMRDEDLSEREFDARLFDPFSTLMNEIPISDWKIRI